MSRITSLFRIHCTLCTFALFAAGCARQIDLETVRTFQGALQQFDASDSPEDYLRAAAMYQEILDSGIVSGTVLYNQGNAFMQAGKRGRAIAAYRHAQRYRPRDPYLDANLNLALGAEPGGSPRRPMIEYILFWQHWLSYPEKFKIVALSAAIAFGFGVCALFLRRRLIKNLAIAAVVLTLLFSFSAGYDWYRYDRILHGVVIQDRVIARKGNATTYEPAFTEPLSEGTEFRLVYRQGNWLRVRLPSDQEGWLPDDSVVLY
ncbi:MAG: hypothetical protein JW829_08130 [Pirellulales bacterium]|nr:hypothetical protein [Pirellulales bacterium]